MLTAKEIIDASSHQNAVKNGVPIGDSNKQAYYDAEEANKKLDKEVKDRFENIIEL